MRYFSLFHSPSKYQLSLEQPLRRSIQPNFLVSQEKRSDSSIFFGVAAVAATERVLTHRHIERARPGATVEPSLSWRAGWRCWTSDAGRGKRDHRRARREFEGERSSPRNKVRVYIRIHTSARVHPPAAGHWQTAGGRSQGSRRDVLPGVPRLPDSGFGPPPFDAIARSSLSAWKTGNGARDPGHGVHASGSVPASRAWGRSDDGNSMVQAGGARRGVSSFLHDAGFVASRALLPTVAETTQEIRTRKGARRQSRRRPAWVPACMSVGKPRASYRHHWQVGDGDAAAEIVRGRLVA